MSATWRDRVERLDPRARAELAARLAAELAPGESLGDPQLVAHVVFRREGNVAPQELDAWIRERLPATFVPARFVEHDALPRTAHGKVDRVALARTPLGGDSSAATTPAPARSDARFEKLTNLFEEILGVRPGPDDDFFALGGHSLAALRLASRIQRELGVPLSVATVFQRPTVRAMADALGQPDPVGSPDPTLVAIQPSGSQRPIFCAHCVKGRVHHYFELARKLGADQPVWALQPEFPDGRVPVASTLEEIAARYVRAIRSVQTQGPYRIAGYSFGGMVAFEMAHQLRRAGESIELLAMFDTVLPGHETGAARTARHRDRLSSLSTGGQIAYVARSAFGNVRTLARRLGRLPAQWRRRWPVAWYRRLGAPLPIELQDAFLEEGHNRAMYRYRATRFPGRLVLFRQGESDWLKSEFPELGWRGFAAEIVVEDVAGRHGEILAEPGASFIAERIRSHLADRGDSADGAGPAR
ncbi:MAG: thioesterase domain-containing protein [bacterium]